ncbi:MAG: molybdate ABC transporter substrate-binding protein [Deltaproteobacteria bacterium]
MKLISLLFVFCSLLFSATANAEKITIAAAADLKYAMDEIISDFRKKQPGDEVQVVYGSSGKFLTQIQQGAPYDLFFSADIGFPRELAKHGLASSDVKPYAVGRIVLWSAYMDATGFTLASLTDVKIKKIAIANPKHAPYGKRAEEALRSSAIWDRVQAKLVYGENIAQTAQYVQSGNAQVGIIALSLVLSPELSNKGGYYLIPDTLHNSLEQGFVITKQGANKPLAKQFADYFGSKQARSVMLKYGFALPGEKAGK